MWLLGTSLYDRNIETRHNQKVIMKLKTLSLIAGTLALTLIATPFAVQAEENSSSPQPGQEWQKESPFKKLNLTPEQKAKIKAIRSNTRTQIEAVLTTAQKTKLQAAMAEHKAQRQQGRGKRGDIFASLGLSTEQKAKMKEIRESSKQQMDAILTPEQRAQIQQMWENMRSRRQQNKPQ